MNATLKIEIGARAFLVPADADFDRDIATNEEIWSINETDLSEIPENNLDEVNKAINNNKFEVLAE